MRRGFSVSWPRMRPARDASRNPSVPGTRPVRRRTQSNGDHWELSAVIASVETGGTQSTGFACGESPPIARTTPTTLSDILSSLAENGHGRKVVARRHGRGVHPGGANSKPANSNPGATVQPTSVQSPRLSAACQARRGTTAWGRSPVEKSAPRRRRRIGPSSASAISNFNGDPA